MLQILYRSVRVKKRDRTMAYKLCSLSSPWLPYVYLLSRLSTAVAGLYTALLLSIFNCPTGAQYLWLGHCSIHLSDH